MWIKLAYIFGHHDLWLAKSFQECAHMDGEVSPDGAGKGSSRVGLTKHYTTSLHCVQTLPNLDVGGFKDRLRCALQFARMLLYHGADRAAGHVGDQTAEESLAGEVSVVLLQVLHGGLHHLHGDQLETLLLKARDNLSNQATLDAVGLDHDEGPLGGHGKDLVSLQQLG